MDAVFFLGPVQVLDTDTEMETAMRRMFSDKQVADETGSNLDSMSRRDFVSLAAVAAAGAGTLTGGDAVAQIPSASPIPRNVTAPGRGGLLYPQQNQVRNLLDLSGLWEFQMDSKEEVDSIRRYLDVAEQRPFMAGMHVWAFADFKTGQSSSRAGSINFKGVFTRDRRPKMAAHFLRERWTKK